MQQPGGGDGDKGEAVGGPTEDNAFLFQIVLVAFSFPRRGALCCLAMLIWTPSPNVTLSLF